MSFITLPIINGFPTCYASSKRDHSHAEEPPPANNTTDTVGTDSATTDPSHDPSHVSTSKNLHLVNIRVISPDQNRENPRNLTLRKIRNLSTNSLNSLPDSALHPPHHSSTNPPTTNDQP